MADMNKDASPARSQPSRRTRDQLVLTGYLMVVAAATLSPGSAEGRQPLLCMMCTELWLLDVLQNVALFGPLGWLLHRCGASVVGAVGWGAGLSLAIEGIQWALPTLGRDAALVDVLANTLGGLLGALLPSFLRWWGAPGSTIARLALAAAWTAFVWGGSWWLVQPAWPTDSPWYAQAAARLGQFDTLPGRVHHGSVNGLSVPFVLPASTVLAAAETPGSVSLAANVDLRGHSRRLAPAVSVYDGRQREVALIAVVQDEVVVRFRTNSARIGLPTLALAPALATDAPVPRDAEARVVLRLRVTGATVCISVVGGRPCHAIRPWALAESLRFGGLSPSSMAGNAGRVVWWILSTGAVPLAVAAIRRR